MTVHGGAHVSSMRQILGSVGFGRACRSYKTSETNCDKLTGRLLERVKMIAEVVWVLM